MLTPEEFEAFQKRYRGTFVRKAYNLGFKRDCDDIAQEIMLVVAARCKNPNTATAFAQIIYNQVTWRLIQEQKRENEAILTHLAHYRHKQSLGAERQIIKDLNAKMKAREIAKRSPSYADMLALRLLGYEKREVLQISPFVTNRYSHEYHLERIKVLLGGGS